ncbi:MAG: PAS domain-containing sensor histidine kinase [Thermodesulfobacteriota bacterium]
MPQAQNDLLAALGQAAGLLREAGLTDAQVERALAVCGQALGCQGLALMRLVCAEDRRQWQPVAIWAGAPRAREAAPALALAATAALGENAGRAAFRLSASGEAPAALLQPLFLGEKPCACLAAWAPAPDPAKPRAQAFLAALTPVLELWLGRCNQEKLTADILDELPLPTLIQDTQGYITVWNPAMAERTGWEAARIVGVGDYIHSIPFYYIRRPMVCDLIQTPDPVWEAVYPEYRRERNGVVSLSYCPNLPGGPIYFRAYTTRLKDLNGRYVGALEFIQDVTEEKVVEKELRRSESLYRTVTDFAGVGILLFSRARILRYNKYVEQLIGSSPDRAGLDKLIELILPEDRDEVQRRFDQLFENPYQTTQFEFRAQMGNMVHTFRGFAGVLDLEDQVTIHFIFDDITRQKELAEKARVNELKLYHEDRLASLGVMAAGIAHELNQPLNTIRVVTEGILYGMEQGWPLIEQELGEELKMVARQVGRMSQVIQNIRDFARNEETPASQELDINLAVENVFSMIGRQLQARGVRVGLELDRGLPLVTGNLHRLEQVIMNLVVNARQALEECDKPLRELVVRTGRAGEEVFVEVEDNATGVPEDMALKIFDPFVTTKEVGQGTGLGLSISKSIVSDLKGDVSFLNNERGGATFRVNLPARA